MRAKERGEVGEGFVPDAKRGKVEIIFEMSGGAGRLREAWPIPWSFFLFFFFFSFFFCNHAFIVSRYKKPHAALAMERTKPINQKHKHKKVTAPVHYPLSRRFLLRRAIGHI